jgi:hypothetical protein
MRFKALLHTSRLAVMLALVQPGCAGSREAAQPGRPDLIHIVVENHTLESVIVQIARRGHTAESLGRILPMSRRVFSMPGLYMRGAELELTSAPLSGRIDVAGRSISTPFFVEGARNVHWTIRDGQLLSSVALR